MDWCDLYFHAVDPETNTVLPVEEVLKVIDDRYELLKVSFFLYFYRIL